MRNYLMYKKHQKKIQDLKSTLANHEVISLGRCRDFNIH